jgi:hypothetical protein
MGKYSGHCSVERQVEPEHCPSERPGPEKVIFIHYPVTESKEKLKELLDDKTEVLKGIVLSYAHDNELNDLVTKVELLAKGFSKKRENDIEPNVKEFLEVVRGLFPKLGDYALTEEMIVEAETLRDQFVALVGAPRNIVVKGTSVNEQIESTRKSTKTFLSKQLDNLMLRFKTSNVAFYNSYTRARQVVEPATSHRDKPEDDSQPT